MLPLYLAADQTGALPELRRVVVAYGNQIAMEPTLELSLQRIFGGRVASDDSGPRAAPRGAPAPAAPDGALAGIAQRAWDAWQKAQEALQRGDWAGTARSKSASRTRSASSRSR